MFNDMLMWDNSLYMQALRGTQGASHGSFSVLHKPNMSETRTAVWRILSMDMTTNHKVGWCRGKLCTKLTSTLRADKSAGRRVASRDGCLCSVE